MPTCVRLVCGLPSQVVLLQISFSVSIHCKHCIVRLTLPDLTGLPGWELQRWLCSSVAFLVFVIYIWPFFAEALFSRHSKHGVDNNLWITVVVTVCASDLY